MAATMGHVDIVKLLVLKGADMKKTSRGITAFDTAAPSGYEKIVDFLIDAGARFDEGGRVAKISSACGKDEGKMLRCQGCLAIHYCCEECQKSDWKDHKALCRNIKVRLKDVDTVLKEMGKQFRNFIVEQAGFVTGPS